MTRYEIRTEGNDLILTRHLDAAPARVWAALTTPDLLKRWFVPAPWMLADAVIEAQPGGRFYTLMRGPAGEEVVGEGCVLLAAAPHRLIWTDALSTGWRPNAQPFVTADMRLEAEGDGTRYTARAIHRNAEDRAKHEAMGFGPGWGAASDQLAALLAGA